MIIDLSKTRNNPFLGKTFDVCICGAGVAGITLALHLSKRLHVALLEAGGLEFTAESQSFYQGTVLSESYAKLTEGRLRYFGGTSNHWTGECRPLDSYDFKPKSYAEHSGWPIRRTDLDPFLDDAEKIVDLSDEEDWDASEGFFEDRISTSSNFRSIRFRTSPPTRFSQKYRQQIEQQSNISCYLNANVTDLHLADGLGKLDRIEVRDYSGNQYHVRSNKFVLATGGIENARILLNSNRQIAAGIGNFKGNVGKYFTEHLYSKVADFILENEARNFVEENPFGTSFKGRLKSQICSSEWLHETFEDLRGRDLDCLSDVRHFFAPSPEYMKRDQILNCAMRMQVRTPGHGESTDGKLFIGSEQTPNSLSRITLDDEVDRFGLRKAKVDWRLSELDMHTIRSATLRFGEAFANLSIGRLRVLDWVLTDPVMFEGTYAHHHMCTTRMAESPRDGVVDKFQKVFGMENLYVAGSSVFSTGGFANPTLTIVQTTLRLANHLSSH